MFIVTEYAALKSKMDSSDSLTILSLRVLGLVVSHINESNCKLMSPEHYLLMTGLQ